MIWDRFKRCGVALTFAAMQLAGHGTAQAQDPADQVFDIFSSVCLATLPNHADAALLAKSIDPAAYHEVLPQAYEGFYGDVLTVEISIDHPSQDQYFCQVESLHVDRERLKDQIESQLAYAIGARLDSGVMDAHDIGSWQAAMSYGTLHFGLTSSEGTGSGKGAILTVIRNVD